MPEYERATMHRLCFLFVLLTFAGITGCSVPPPPPTEEIDKGVNWSLSGMIIWEYKDRNLFERYEITNHYVEKRNDGVAYIYDFKASCVVMNFGDKWMQAFYLGEGPNKNGFIGEDHSFKGTFTLIKKGNAWYRKETIR